MSLFEWLSIIAYFAQLGLIYYGLRRMEQTGQRRDRQLDEMLRQSEESRVALREIGAGIREQSAGIRALLER